MNPSIMILNVLKKILSSKTIQLSLEEENIIRNSLMQRGGVSVEELFELKNKTAVLNNKDDIWNVEYIASKLKAFNIGVVKYFDEIASTQGISMKLASEKQSGYSLVIAGRQFRGRGRYGRLWFSDYGGLWFSIGFSKPNKTGLRPALSLATGLGVVKGIEATLLLRLGLKWPNDIVWNRRKVGGILIESLVSEESTVFTVGIGLNVNNPIEKLPQNVGKIATSISRIVGHQIPRVPLLLNIVSNTIISIEKYFTSPGRIVEEWKEYDVLYGRQVSVELYPGKIVKGVEKGVSRGGELLLEDNTGKIVRVAMGEIVGFYGT